MMTEIHFRSLENTVYIYVIICINMIYSDTLGLVAMVAEYSVIFEMVFSEKLIIDIHAGVLVYNVMLHSEEKNEFDFFFC